MKNDKAIKKLKLHRQTLRVLTDWELTGMQGGNQTTSVQASQVLSCVDTCLETTCK